MSVVRHGGPELRGAPLPERVLVRVLPSVPRSAEVARAATRVACRSWSVPQSCDTAALVTTELVGNSVRHARTRDLTLRLAMTPRRLRIEVQDADPTLPRTPWRELLGEGHRGLWIVSQLAVRWGVEPSVDGKTVWVELPLPGDDAC